MLIVKKRSEIPSLTDKDREQLRQASKKPIVYDEDCPETSDEEFIDFMAKYFDKSVEPSDKNEKLA